MAKLPSGVSYARRVTEINRIYAEHAKRGLTNRAIWRLYIYPIFGICERSFYKAIKAEPKQKIDSRQFPPLFTDNIDGDK